MPRLNNRSHGSVELKYQNISAVLIEMGMPYVSGLQATRELPAIAAASSGRRAPRSESATTAALEQNCHENPSGTKCWRHSSSSRRDACALQVKSNDSCGEHEPLLVGQSGLFGA